MTRTPWFPANTKPVRVGVYEREYEDGAVWFCHWDGLGWSIGCLPAIAALKHSAIKSSRNHLPWRGLTEESK